MIRTAVVITLAALLRRSEADLNCSIPVECDCPAEVSKVCGATGKTYDNECFARCDGVWSCAGECPQACADNPPPGWSWFRCDTLPHYWRCLADEFGIDYCRLGFDISEGQWYIDGKPACVGWGEFNVECNWDHYYCAGAEERYAGYGVEQMAALKTIIDGNLTVHPLCPCCPPDMTTPGFVDVCHDGVKYSFPEQPENIHDFGLPGSMALEGRGTWVSCDCVEVHRGFRLEEGSYWWNTALQAGLDPALVTHYNGVWYYDGKYTCVGRGVHNVACQNLELVCNGPGNTFGWGLPQLLEVAAAAALPSGEHAYCPVP